MPQLRDTLHQIFQSTPSAWRVTTNINIRMDADLFQSTPSAWRVTDWLLDALHDGGQISIHTLRMEGD